MAQTALNNALRRERELRGWSQRYVAEQIEAPSQFYISRWERGVTTPSPYYREKLCRLFEKNAQELGLVQIQEEAKNEESHSKPELITDWPSSMERKVSKSALAPQETLYIVKKYKPRFTRYKWFFLSAFSLTLLTLFVASSFAMRWQPIPPRPTSISTTKRIWPRLQFNIHVKSQEVMTMQYMLKARVYDVGPTGADGIYGPATDNAVKAFQEANHLPQNNGVDGPMWEHLIMPSAEENYGSQVRALQVQLNTHHIGPALGVDGDFGPATEKAVRQFQQANHLRITGRADLDVWCLLVGGHIQ
jgi:transcriptional regulator with XRE-family HTH domain